MKNNISKTLDEDVIYLAFSRHEWDWKEVKSNPAYLFQWIGSIGIRILTLSKYSHIDYVSELKDNKGYNKMLGAIPNGGLIYRTQHNNNFHALYSLNIAGKKEFVDFIESQIGSKYDISALFGFIYPKRNWNKLDKWFCSEIIAAGLNKIDVEFDEKMSLVSPDDLYFRLEIDNIIKRIRKLND